MAPFEVHYHDLRLIFDHDIHKGLEYVNRPSQVSQENVLFALANDRLKLLLKYRPDGIRRLYLDTDDFVGLPVRLEVHGYSFTGDAPKVDQMNDGLVLKGNHASLVLFLVKPFAFAERDDILQRNAAFLRGDLTEGAEIDGSPDRSYDRLFVVVSQVHLNVFSGLRLLLTERLGHYALH